MRAVAGGVGGLVGAGAIIVRFVALLWRAVRIASRGDERFGRLAGAGVSCWFGCQAFQNIGMCLGMMPVTGVPLPLVSYGGTAMLSVLAACGLLISVYVHRDVVITRPGGGPG
mgnify:CR=1 FL=1